MLNRSQCLLYIYIHIGFNLVFSTFGGIDSTFYEFYLNCCFLNKKFSNHLNFCTVIIDRFYFVCLLIYKFFSYSTPCRSSMDYVYVDFKGFLSYVVVLVRHIFLFNYLSFNFNVRRREVSETILLFFCSESDPLL